MGPEFREKQYVLMHSVSICLMGEVQVGRRWIRAAASPGAAGRLVTGSPETRCMLRICHFF